MPIKVVCPQGHKLSAPEKIAGKRVQCPKCKSVVQIPELESPETDEGQGVNAAPAPQPDADPLDLDPLAGSDPLADSDFAGAEDGSMLDAAPGALPLKTEPSKGVPPLVWALMGGGTVLALVLIVGVAMLLMGAGEDEAVVADNPPAEAKDADNAGPASKDDASGPTEPEPSPKSMETKPEPEPAPPLHFHGLYIASIGDHRRFLRFYEDGTVLSVDMQFGSTDAKLAGEVAEWFNKDHTRPLPRGRYEQAGAKLTIKTSIPPNDLAPETYEGTVEDGLLNLKSSQEYKPFTFRFVEVALDPIVLNTENLADTKEKLKRIALAFHNFHDTYRCFALPRSDGSNESPPSRGAKPTGLSWRVHLLPFLDQRPLFERFHRDEPWDSPHNKTLLEHMPEIYRIGSNDEPVTRFQVITGPEMLFGNPKTAGMRDLTDGTSNTILALVVGADVAVPWTKPDELTLDENAAKSSLGSLTDGYIACVLADGRTLTVLKSIEPADFLAMATPHGNEIVHPDRHGRRFEEALKEFVAKSQPPSDTTTDVAASPGSASPSTGPASSPLKGLDLHGRLQAIAYALLMHHDHFMMFTHPVSESKHGSGLSWRVHVLPFLGEHALYRKFHLNEPWDSPHNKTLLDEMPEIYQLEDPVRTRFVVFTGPEMVFGTNRQPSYRYITDGPANTLLAIVAGPDSAVPWTQPADLPFEPENAASLIQSMAGGPIECVTADGKLLTLPDGVPENTFKALVTPAGGEVVDVDAVRRQFGPADQEPPPALKQLIETVAKSKQERLNKLKQISLGMLNYHDTYRQYPLARNPKLFNDEGKPYLSWRVHLLPFMDQGPLYKQFKLDEPWDSPHNKELLKELPDVYRDPQDPLDSTNTRFVVLTGPGTPFAGQYGPSIRDMRDGTSNTVLALVAGDDKAVPWTKPEDIAFDPNAPIACLGNVGPALFCVKADGAAHSIKPSIPPDVFKGLVSPAGGEVLPRELINYGFR